ncbi:MAG TPA: alpha/beta fold hydrolase [Anaerolineales bacterium]|nr:alpha/beta fold hydrolase [Anaerolineales bacterium]
MKLEIISEYPAEKTHATPLLFVHGAWHGAWCWENFLPYFAKHGYEAHALSLRGHANSEGRNGIRWYSTSNYLTDLSQVVNTMSAPPILVGHSMGGYIVQKHLESQSAPAAVLLASIPTVGILGMFLRWFKRHPVSILKTLFLLNPWYMVSTPAQAKEVFFSDDFPNEKFLEYYSRIQAESVIMALEASLLHLPRPRKVQTPLLVIGAENDRIFTVSEQRKTAQAYNTEATIYPNIAHDIMLEPGWGAVADDILEWLNSRNL